MAGLVFGAIAPHGSEIIEALAGDMAARTAPTRSAMEELSRRLQAAPCLPSFQAVSEAKPTASSARAGGSGEGGTGEGGAGQTAHPGQGEGTGAGQVVTELLCGTGCVAQAAIRPSARWKTLTLPGRKRCANPRWKTTCGPGRWT